MFYPFFFFQIKKCHLLVKENIKKIKIKFQVISIHGVKIWSHFNKNWSSYLITKLYQFCTLCTLYISNDIKFFEILCTYDTLQYKTSYPFIPV